MAEPVILAYGQGLLPGLPGLARRGHRRGARSTSSSAPWSPRPPRRRRRGEPAWYQVGSSARNPLRFAALYEHVRTYFSAHPLPQRGRGSYAVPVWDFAGETRLERRLRFAERGHRLADRALSVLPAAGVVRRATTRLDDLERRLRSVRRLSDLYHAYTQAELVYDDRSTLALHEAMAPEDQALFGCDVAAVDWRHYLVDLHCPSVTGLLRWADALPPKRRRPAARPSPTRPAAPSPPSTWTARCCRPPSSRRSCGCGSPTRRAAGGGASWPGWSPTCPGCSPPSGTPARPSCAPSPSATRAPTSRRWRPWSTSGSAPRCCRGSRPARCGPCASTGPRGTAPCSSPARSTRSPARSPRCSTRCVAARLEVGADGRATGRLAEPPVVGEARAAWLARRAADEGWDLGASSAYADSLSDLPMLRAVGQPVAVNPDAGAGPGRAPGEVAGRALGVDARRALAVRAGRSPRREGAGGLPVAAALPGEPRRVRAGCPPRPPPGWPRCGWPSGRRRDRRGPAGCACARCCPASAAATSRPSAARRRSTSRRWCPGRSRPATRWSASCSTTRRACPPAAAWSSTPCCPAARAASTTAAPAPPAPPTAARG